MEPDGFQEPNFGWTGLETTIDLLDRLREDLGRVAGAGAPVPPPRFCWFLRMDPQVESVYGRADEVAVAFGDALRHLEDEGDVFGSHIHPLRWSDGRGQWVHEFGDTAWTTHCIDVSFDAYVKVFGDRPLRHRYGVGYLDDHVVAALDSAGVVVDLTPEPGTRPRANNRLPDVASGVDAAPRTAPTTDCSRMPRRPYHPSLEDFRRVGTDRRRGLVLLPLSSTLVRPGQPRWRQAAGVVKRRAVPEPQPMRMAAWAHVPQLFWDRAARHLLASRRPFLSLALRTDAPGSGDATRTRAVLEYLPRHPLARRLRFVDPLTEVQRLL